VLVGLADIASQLAAELPGRYPQLARGLHEAGAVMSWSWRGSRAGRGFWTVPGRLGGDRDEQGVLATATQDGTLRVLLHFAPWGGEGLSLDFVSRDRSAPAGLEELLIAEVIV
jgi:lysylphosphatidylglycerol synthetase-like protein (DUF2156 family)